MKKKKSSTTTQRILLSRLRLMGYILLLFSVGFFWYAWEAPSSSEQSLTFLPEEELSAFADLSPHDTFNFFAVSSLFAVLGISCLLTAHKKNRSQTKRKKT